jgi:hypothetical protein
VHAYGSVNIQNKLWSCNKIKGFVSCTRNVLIRDTIPKIVAKSADFSLMFRCIQNHTGCIFVFVASIPQQ